MAGRLSRGSRGRGMEDEWYVDLTSAGVLDLFRKGERTEFPPIIVIKGLTDIVLPAAAPRLPSTYVLQSVLEGGLGHYISVATAPGEPLSLTSPAIVRFTDFDPDASRHKVVIEKPEPQ